MACLGCALGKWSTFSSGMMSEERWIWRISSIPSRRLALLRVIRSCSRDSAACRSKVSTQPASVPPSQLFTDKDCDNTRMFGGARIHLQACHSPSQDLRDQTAEDLTTRQDFVKQRAFNAWAISSSGTFRRLLFDSRSLCRNRLSGNRYSADKELVTAVNQAWLRGDALIGRPASPTFTLCGPSSAVKLGAALADAPVRSPYSSQSSTSDRRGA